MEVWITSPDCEMLGEGPGYFATLEKLIAAGQISGGMIQDARVAALCLHHGARELWTSDRDFSRFPDLRTLNPLVKSA